MVQRVLQEEGRVRFKAGRPDLRFRFQGVLFWKHGFMLDWEIGAVSWSHMVVSVLNPDGVFHKREKEHSVASRVEKLGGVICLVCHLGNLRSEFLENLDG
jgi:hypothetical protein